MPPIFTILSVFISLAWPASIQSLATLKPNLVAAESVAKAGQGFMKSPKDSFFDIGAGLGVHQYSSNEIPPGAVPSSEPARFVMSDSFAVGMSFCGVDPKSPYGVELTFLSDTDSEARRHFVSLVDVHTLTIICWGGNEA